MKNKKFWVWRNQVVYGVRNGSGEATITSSGKMKPKKEGTVTVYATASGMTTETTRTVSITGYASADLAAIGFGERCFASSYGTQRQYSTAIYMSVVSGIVCYGYVEPILVSPSATGFLFGMPEIVGGTVVAYVHTAPLTSGIQDYDEDFVNENELDCYVVGVDHSVYVYEYINQEPRLVGYH